MNYQETLSFLFSQRRAGIKLGLENISKLLQKLGNPHKNFKSVHIAGTNGKGSTSSFTASILKELGFKVGLYTSPHLSRFNERISINGNLIDDNYIIEKTESLNVYIKEFDLSFFDITTAIAFNYFSDNKVDFAVIETGLGGRLDSTNIISPEISIITTIGMDHSQFLGDTLEKIAFEKGGIIKPRIPVITGNIQNSQLEILEKIAKAKQTKIYKTTDLVSRVTKNTFPEMTFEIISNISGNLYEVQSPLFGEYQINNIASGILAIELMLKPEEIKTEIIKKGIEQLMKNFPLLGRFQILQRTPTFILDIAHNSQAINELLSQAKKINAHRKIAVFAVMKDKNIGDMIESIGNTFDEIYVCAPETERAMEPETLKNLFFKKRNVFNLKNVYICMNHLLSNIKSNDYVFIFGSNYLIAEVMDFLKISKLKREQII